MSLTPSTDIQRGKPQQWRVSSVEIRAERQRYKARRLRTVAVLVKAALQHKQAWTTWQENWRTAIPLFTVRNPTEVSLYYCYVATDSLCSYKKKKERAWFLVQNETSIHLGITSFNTPISIWFLNVTFPLHFRTLPFQFPHRVISQVWRRDVFSQNHLVSSGSPGDRVPVM